MFRLLAACRGLREGPLDPFARTAERRLERRLREEILSRLQWLTANLNEANLPATIEFAESVMEVRGFGAVKAPAAEALLSKLDSYNETASKSQSHGRR